MKRVAFYLLLLITFSQCSSNDDPSGFPSISGNTYVIDRVEIDIPIDINGDGIYSTNLVDEVAQCFGRSITFRENGKVNNPAVTNVISFQVNLDFNGNPVSQQASCPILDFPETNYTQSDQSIRLNNTGAAVFVTGTVSESLDRLVFEFTFQNFVAQSTNGGGVSGNLILNENGSITDYEGNITLTYRRQ